MDLDAKGDFKVENSVCILHTLSCTSYTYGDAMVKQLKYVTTYYIQLWILKFSSTFLKSIFWEFLSSKVS